MARSGHLRSWAGGAIVAMVLAGACGAAQAAGAKLQAVGAKATVLQPVSVATGLNLSSGAVKTNGSSASGTVRVPASYPALANPKPTYANTTAVNGANAVAPNAARVDITGTPGQSYTISVQSWTLVSGQAGSSASVALTTFYSPNAVSATGPSGVLNAQGKATVYIGSTITVQRNNAGTTVVLKPNYMVTYN